jgi:hypothetical protein
MHRALLVSEILLDIFAHVNTILDPLSFGEISLTRKSLVALATTCGTFYEPAMDLLWADMHGIVPLLGCVTRLHPMIYHHAGGRVSADQSRSVHVVSFISSLSV